jgi:hypothetical protein
MKETLKLYDMREWPPLPDKLGEALRRSARKRRRRLLARSRRCVQCPRSTLVVL